jgi:hypothetical protein
MRANIDVHAPDECWPWLGAMNKGYGVITVEGRSASAHRVSYELAYGPIPPGMSVLHRCDNRACCNPGHMFLGLQADNMHDMADKGRAISGCAHHSAKLNTEQVIEIRSSYARGGVSMHQLATRFGITVETIHGIIHRRYWKHVTP